MVKTVVQSAEHCTVFWLGLARALFSKVTVVSFGSIASRMPLYFCTRQPCSWIVLVKFSFRIHLLLHRLWSWDLITCYSYNELINRFAICSLSFFLIRSQHASQLWALTIFEIPKVCLSQRTSVQLSSEGRNNHGRATCPLRLFMCLCCVAFLVSACLHGRAGPSNGAFLA